MKLVNVKAILASVLLRLRVKYTSLFFLVFCIWGVALLECQYKHRIDKYNISWKKDDLQVLPLRRHNRIVCLHGPRDLLVNAVVQPLRLQLLVALLAQMQWITTA